MKVWLLALMVMANLSWAEDGEDQDLEITDKQRCEEWAEMDGIPQEDMGDYMKECLSSLNYEAEMSEEEAQ